MMSNKTIRKNYTTSKQCKITFILYRLINKIHFVVDGVYNVCSQKFCGGLDNNKTVCLLQEQFTTGVWCWSQESERIKKLRKSNRSRGSESGVNRKGLNPGFGVGSRSKKNSVTEIGVVSRSRKNWNTGFAVGNQSREILNVEVGAGCRSRTTYTTANPWVKLFHISIIC